MRARRLRLNHRRNQHHPCDQNLQTKFSFPLDLVEELFHPGRCRLIYLFRVSDLTAASFDSVCIFRASDLQLLWASRFIISG